MGSFNKRDALIWIRNGKDRAIWRLLYEPRSQHNLALPCHLPGRKRPSAAPCVAGINREEMPSTVTLPPRSRSLSSQANLSIRIKTFFSYMKIIAQDTKPRQEGEFLVEALKGSSCVFCCALSQHFLGSFSDWRWLLPPVWYQLCAVCVLSCSLARVSMSERTVFSFPRLLVVLRAG